MLPLNDACWFLYYMIVASQRIFGEVNRWTNPLVIPFLLKRWKLIYTANIYIPNMKLCPCHAVPDVDAAKLIALINTIKEVLVQIQKNVFKQNKYELQTLKWKISLPIDIICGHWFIWKIKTAKYRTKWRCESGPGDLFSAKVISFSVRLVVFCRPSSKALRIHGNNGICRKRHQYWIETCIKISMHSVCMLSFALHLTSNFFPPTDMLFLSNACLLFVA